MLIYPPQTHYDFPFPVSPLMSYLTLHSELWLTFVKNLKRKLHFFMTLTNVFAFAVEKFIYWPKNTTTTILALLTKQISLVSHLISHGHGSVLFSADSSKITTLGTTYHSTFARKFPILKWKEMSLFCLLSGSQITTVLNTSSDTSTF